MDAQFKPALVEKAIYDFWEKNGYFTAKVDKQKQAFCIILPLPNANGSLHLGHAMFVHEDLMIRYHKIIGDETLWQLGLDHAGFETQYVYEKYLRKQGKSRFDFDRETLYQNIWQFVTDNKGNIKNQMRRLGFALDWSKEKFTLDPDIVQIVYQTFTKLHDAGLLYRANRLVNYCTRDGTSFSDLEVVDQEKEGTLYFIKYPLAGGGFITVATTRPETMFGDVAVMVNPKDKRYAKLVGQKVQLPLTKRIIPIIADPYVDQKFGTGAVKVTPAHDFNDFEIGKKHSLAFICVIGFDGRMQNTGIVDGLKVLPAREQTLKLLQEKGLVEKSAPHKMVAKTCYRCGNILELLPLEQWYVRVRPLVDKAKELVDKGEIKVYPKRFVRRLDMILDNFIDWNISRQVVWGIRIPAWQCAGCHEWIITAGEKPAKCSKCGSTNLQQDSDTFDTWFSSAQWPFATLRASHNEEFYDYFYPTSVMETGHDILRAWVARMIMIDYFITGKVPFKNVFLHGMVRDAKGQKMSKSKGNVIDPLIMVDKYGADALRAALIFGTKEGGDVVLSEQKIIGMRNFANKIWNIGRFIDMHISVIPSAAEGSLNAHLKTKLRDSSAPTLTVQNDSEKTLKQLNKEFKDIKKKYTRYMKGYRFSSAFDLVYHYLWHRYADYYIEQLKESLRNGNIKALEVLEQVYFETLAMLHPFIPFVTEAVWQQFHGVNSSILNYEKDMATEKR